MPGGLWHVETFQSKEPPGVLEQFLKEDCLPYWRSRGFNVKVFVTQFSLGGAQLWLLTELESFASFEAWTEMAVGEPRGEALMDRLAKMTTSLHASVVRDLEEPGHGR